MAQVMETEQQQSTTSDASPIVVEQLQPKGTKATETAEQSPTSTHGTKRQSTTNNQAMEQLSTMSDANDQAMEREYSTTSSTMDWNTPMVVAQQQLTDAQGAAVVEQLRHASHGNGTAIRGGRTIPDKHTWHKKTIHDKQSSHGTVIDNVRCK